jgi:hypothetical protein
VLGDDLMAPRVVFVAGDRFEQERLYAHDTIAVPEAQPGDQVVLVAAVEPPVVFGLGEATTAGLVTYTWKNVDDGMPFSAREDPAVYASRVEPRRSQVWMVSLDLPIEAPTAAEAVRRFWSYVRELGPQELPTYVSPAGDELALQAFVLGEEANQDPEED